MSRDLLAFHGRLPRRPMATWIASLSHALSTLLHEGMATRSRGMRSIYNQAALLMMLKGDQKAARAVLDLQSQFLRSPHLRGNDDEVLIGLQHIELNNARIDRISGAIDVAIEKLRGQLNAFDSPQWTDLRTRSPQEYESAKADVLIEFCKTLLARGDRAGVQICLSIATAGETAPVLLGVALDTAAALLIRNHDLKGLERLHCHPVLRDADRNLVQLRQTKYRSTQRDLDSLNQRADLLVHQARQLGQMDFEFADHLYFMRFVADTFQDVGWTKFEMDVRHSLCRAARKLRDIQFFYANACRLSTIRRTDARIGLGSWQSPNRAVFPIFSSSAALSRTRLNLLLDRLTEVAAAAS